MKLFVLDRADENSTKTSDYVIHGSSNEGPASRCIRCAQCIEMLHWLPPHQVEIRIWGQRATDFAFGGPLDLLVSEQFFKLYMKNGLTGLDEIEPVSVVNVKLNGKKYTGKIPNYYHARAIISSAIVDDIQSGI